MKMLQLKLPHSSLIWYQLNSGSCDEEHGHGDNFQISIPLMGTPHMQQGSSKIRLHPLRRAVIAPGELHRNFALNHDARWLLLNINRPFLESIYTEQTGHDTSLEFSPWADGSSQGLVKLAETALQQFLHSSPASLELQQLEQELAALLLTLHAGSHTELWQRERSVSGHAHAALKRALGFIHDNFTSAEWSLDMLSAASGVSKSHLIRLFHVHHGSTPSRYITALRIRRAEDLLKHSSLDITAVAYEVGFGSLSAFERAFRKARGLTPREYRGLSS